MRISGKVMLFISFSEMIPVCWNDIGRVNSWDSCGQAVQPCFYLYFLLGWETGGEIDFIGMNNSCTDKGWVVHISITSPIHRFHWRRWQNSRTPQLTTKLSFLGVNKATSSYPSLPEETSSQHWKNIRDFKYINSDADTKTGKKTLWN